MWKPYCRRCETQIKQYDNLEFESEVMPMIA
jgi:hypothetical protein